MTKVAARGPRVSEERVEREGATENALGALLRRTMSTEAQLEVLQDEFARLGKLLEEQRDARNGKRRQAASPITGTVLETTDQRDGTTTHLVLDLGTYDGVSVGTTFEVYWGSEYKGQVTVQRASTETSACAVTRRVAGRSFAAGDKVTTRL